MLLGGKSPEQTVIQGLVARGVPIHIAQGMTANMIAESNLNPGINEIAPVVPGSRGGWGLNQWTGPRRKAFEAFAAERGASLDDLNTQLDFTMYELQGPEAKAWAAIQGAKDPIEAARLYSETFLRPGTPNMDKRLSEASRIAGMPVGNVTASTKGGGMDGLLNSGPSAPAEEKKRGLLGLFSDPDKRAQLAIALEGMTLNPNTALMGMLGEGVKDRRSAKKTTESTNKTAAWLRSIGQDQLAAALETGVVDPGAVVGQALQAMQPKEAPSPIEVGGVLLDPVTFQPIFDSRQAEAGYTTVSQEEAASLGLPPGAYQRAADGKISQIGGGDVNIDMGAGETAFNKKTGEILATEADAIVQQGAAAQRSLGQIVTLEEALKNSPQGMAGGLAGWASGLGIKTEGSSDLELANAIISQLVPQQRAPGSGTMSDADLALFKQSLPSLVNTPEGNTKIIGTMKAIAHYDMQRAGIARRLQMGEITPSVAFEEYQALGNPLAEFVTVPEKAPAGGVVRKKFNPATGGFE